MIWSFLFVNCYGIIYKSFYTGPKEIDYFQVNSIRYFFNYFQVAVCISSEVKNAEHP
jgi:hypothetical protein